MDPGLMVSICSSGFGCLGLQGPGCRWLIWGVSIFESKLTSLSLSGNLRTHPVTAAILVIEDLLNSLSFSLNFLFLLSVPMVALVAVR